MSHNLIEDRREYPLGQVKSADVEVMVYNGSLAITGGAEAYCSAFFEYSHPELRPIDDYEANGEEARLDLRQPKTHGLREARSAWNLAFNSDVTNSIAIESMSGSVDLDLDRVLLADLEVKSKSGAVRTSLGGTYPDLNEVIIESTSGKVDARLDGTFPALSTFEIESKSGSTTLAITGDCPELRRVVIDSMSGAIDLDLRGQFHREDLGVRIESKSGRVRVRLPDSVGASLNASTMSGRVRADGFSGGSGRWTNAAFERTPATIWLNIRAMSGSIDVVSG